MWILFMLLLAMACSCSPQPVQKNCLKQEMLEGLPLKSPAYAILKSRADSISQVKVVEGVVCSFFRRGKSHYALSLQTEEGELIGNFVEYGTDLHQMLIAYPSYGSGKVVLRDLIARKITMISPGAIVSGSANTEVQIFKSDIIAQTLVPFGDRLLFLNPYSLEGKTPRVLVSDRKWNYHWRKKYNYTTINLNRGTLMYNPERGKIAYASENCPIIELMSEKGRLLKTIAAPHETGIISEDSHEGFIDYVYYESVPCCFTSADSNSQYFVTSFNTDQKESLILLFDWDGKFMQGFKSAYDVKVVSLSDNGGSVYCWETDGMYDYLNKYPLDEE